MKLGKHVKDPGSGVCLDRISSLPDELLGHMLSFLPTACAVSTSILSTRWRYLFTLTNRLSFDDAPCYDVWWKIDSARQIRFKMFVDKVLELHQISPIKKFSLKWCCTFDEFDVKAWVSNAVQKGVQVLKLDYHGNEEVYEFLPDRLFKCETLVSLKMIFTDDYEFKIPISAWLPRLKILHLEYAKFFDYDSMERMFSSCGLLENLFLCSCECEFDTSRQIGHVLISTRLLKVLSIDNCSFEGGLFEIDAPNLAYLMYCSSAGVKFIPSWKYSGSLIKAELFFSDCVKGNTRNDSLEYEHELFKAAAYKATVLHLLTSSPKFFEPDDEETPFFHNLLSLHLGHFTYHEWEYVISLLEKSPKLERVVFDEGLHHCELDPMLPPDDVPLIPFSCNVKEIVVHNFCGHEGSLLLLGHLLRNAGALKELTVRKRYSSTRNIEEELRMCKGLLMLPRASRDCFIDFNLFFVDADEFLT